MTPWIVVPFTRPDFAQNLSDNIERQTRSVRVCVVEVGSATQCACAALGIPADVVIRAPDGTHAGPARNMGVRYLQMKEPHAPVLFFDDDDYYGPAYVSDALAALQAQPSASFTFQAVAWVRDESDMLWHTDSPRDTLEPLPVAGATIAVGRVSDCLPFPDTLLNEDASWGGSMLLAGMRGWCRQPLECSLHFRRNRNGYTDRFTVRE